MAVQAQYLAHAFPHDSRATRYVSPSPSPHPCRARAACMSAPSFSLFHSLMRPALPSFPCSPYLSVSPWNHHVPASRFITCFVCVCASVSQASAGRRDGRVAVPWRARGRSPAGCGRGRQHAVQRSAQRAHLQQQQQQ
uniref:Uncharacterized protein n=1 Tax=Arundo donax TaxID=35708 RepID=A0A0A9AGD2_ARUDO